MSIATDDAAFVAALARAVVSNTLAADHLHRLRRAGRDLAELTGDFADADGYVVTAVVHMLAVAESERVEAEEVAR